jgi:hypothetical protein
MAALIAQLNDGGGDGEKDADAARTLAAKAGARGSRGVRIWEAPDDTGALLKTVRLVPAAAHATSISRASRRRAGVVAPFVSTLFAPDAVVTEESGPTADIPDNTENGIIAAALPDDAGAESTRIAQLEADLARSRAQLADVLAQLAAVEARVDAVDAAHGATAAERDVARVALHERDAALAAVRARVRAVEAEVIVRERARGRGGGRRARACAGAQTVHCGRARVAGGGRAAGLPAAHRARRVRGCAPVCAASRWWVQAVIRPPPASRPASRHPRFPCTMFPIPERLKAPSVSALLRLPICTVAFRCS